jgi:geranylgeranyl pyrophosphate synthase
LENKKTILYHLALEKADPRQSDLLKLLLSGEQPISDENKIIKTKYLFKDTGAKEAAKLAIFHYSDLATKQLEKLTIDEKQKESFLALKDWLMNRTY